MSVPSPLTMNAYKFPGEADLLVNWLRFGSHKNGGDGGEEISQPGPIPCKPIDQRDHQSGSCAGRNAGDGLRQHLDEDRYEPLNPERLLLSSFELYFVFLLI